MSLIDLIRERYARLTEEGGILDVNNNNQGLLGNISDRALLGSAIYGQGIQGKNPFEALLPATLQTGQVKKLLTPKDKRTNLQKNLEAAGFLPGTPEYKQAILAATAKTEAGAGNVGLVSKSNIDNAKISADYSLKGLDLIKRINTITDRSPDAFGIAGAFKGFGKDVATEVEGIYKDARGLAREGTGIEAGALSFIDNKDFSGISPLQNSLKIILARSRNPNNRLLKDMLVEAGDDSNLRGLGGVQKAKEKLQFVAAELYDNAVRQYRAAGFNDQQIQDLVLPYENIFKSEVQQTSPITNIPVYSIDPKTKKLKKIK